MGLGVGPSGAFSPSWPLRAGTARDPIQSWMQPCLGVIEVPQYLVSPLHIKRIVWLSVQIEWHLACPGNLRHEDTDHFRRGCAEVIGHPVGFIQ